MTRTPFSEQDRHEALARYAILDTPREAAFDDIAELAAAICETPIAVVNLIDSDRQFFKAEVGLGVRSTPLETSFCAKALLEEDYLEVADASMDPRFECNPLVTGEPGLRFYAGALLKTAAGVPIGTLCVLDYTPRILNHHQRTTLRILARQVMANLDLQRIAAEHARDLARARASEEEWRLVLDSARDYAIITIDTEGKITSWSAGAETAFQRTSSNAIGRHFAFLFTPEDRAEKVPEQELTAAAREGSALDIRWHLRADGSRVFMNGSTHPLRRGGDGRPVGFLKIARNETDRHLQTQELARTRSELVDSETRFRNMADHAPVMMWVTDPSGYCTYLNRKWYEYTGQTEEEAEGYGWLDATHPDDKAEAERAFAEANEAHKPLRIEYRLKTADGSYRWAIDAASPRFGEGGEYLGYVGSVIDIEERREAEARIRESEEQLRLATDAADIGFWDVDLENDTLFWPPRVKAMFGISPDVPVTMQDFYDGLHTDDSAATTAAFLSAADPERRAIYDVEYRTIGKEDAEIRWVAAKGKGLFDRAGVCRRVLGAAIDITARKRVEQELQELNETLEQKVEEEVAARTATEEALRQAQKMEAVGQLTGGIAHDFNNLLAGIGGSLDIIERRLEQGRTEDLGRFINGAQTSTQRAAALTQRLLAFSRRQTLDPRPTDVNRLVCGMEDLIRRTVGPGIAVEVVGAAGLWAAQVDAGQLESALLNLAINARDAMPEGGRLTLETANKWLDERAARERDLPPGQYLSVCVTDSGTGIPKEIVDRIFDPFFTTKPIGQGTGLGLSMIHGFVRQSGGQVRVYTEPGQGTTMCLYLPRYTGDMSEEDVGRDLGIALSGAGETVLVIDDEPLVRMLIVELLEEAGYGVLEAGDGISGLKILESSARIDLLVTDVGLPGGMNGRQVADAARVARPGLKVLFVTGYAENAAVGNGHLDPGMEVITKPFVMTEFANKVHDMIER